VAIVITGRTAGVLAVGNWAHANAFDLEDQIY